MDSETKKEKNRMIKNLVISSLWGLLLMASATPLETMQSTVNTANGIGTLSLSIGVAVSIISLFFMPYLADFFGLKILVVFGTLAVSLYALANTYPNSITLVAGAIIFKAIASVAVSSNLAIVTFYAEGYANLTSLPKEKIYSIIFGALITSINLGIIVGSSITAVFMNGLNGSENVTENVTSYVSNRELCGPYFVDSQHTSDHSKIAPTGSLLVLFVIFAIIGLLASVMAGLFMDSIPPTLKTGNLVLETLRLMKNKYALLIIMSDFHRGLTLGAVNADFSKAYSSCLGGLPLLEMSVIFMGVAIVLFSPVFSFIAKRFNRIVVFAIVMLLECVLISILLSWSPTRFSDDRSFVLSMSTFLGIDGAGNSFLFYMLHGYLFPEMKEASMALCVLAENLGVSLSYALSNVMSAYYKLLLIFIAMIISCICYLGVEIPLSRSIVSSSSIVPQLHVF